MPELKFVDYLKTLAPKDWDKKVISVPLSLWSSSKSLSVAEKFLKRRSQSEYENIILSIKVVNLDP